VLLIQIGTSEPWMPTGDLKDVVHRGLNPGAAEKLTHLRDGQWDPERLRREVRGR